MRLRPTLVVHLTVPRDEAIELVRERVSRVVPARNWLGKGRWCEVHLPPEEQRLWSPYLSLRLDHEPEGSSIFARFAPRAEVWTLFMFAYSLLSFIALFAATFGYVQWASNEPAWGFQAAVAAVLGIGVLYGISFAGQRLSAPQTHQLIAQLGQIVDGLPTADPAPLAALHTDFPA